MTPDALPAASAATSGSRPAVAVEGPQRWRRLWWAHPELSLAGVAVAAWAGMVGYHVWSTFSPAHGDMTHGAAAHDAVAHDAVPHDAVPHEAMTGHASAGLLLSIALWMVMATAMMLPTVLPAARFIALNGRWTRRQRGPALYAAAYLAVWAAAGAVVYGALWALSTAGISDAGAGSLWALGTALAIAAAWELTPWKRHFLRACHRLRSIPPTGGRADRACLDQGVRNGISCLGACGPMMLPMVVAPHALAMWLMIPLTVAICAEKLLTRGVLHIRRVAAGLAGAAGLVLSIAALVPVSQ